MKKKPNPLILRLMIANILVFVSTVGSSAQNVFPSPRFEAMILQAMAGKQLTFTLTNLPDPKLYGAKDGTLEVQVNWRLGDDCGTGSSFSERVKIRSATHRLQTSYLLSKADDGKKLKLSVSYVEPTDDPEMPAKSYIAGTKDCAVLKVLKK